MRKAKILIADDSDKLLSALRCNLEPYGFEVTICADSYTALAQARKDKPDVMILDIRMPAGDGFSVLERMEKIPELHDVPVIYITGNQSSELTLRAEQLGACGLIHKPISLPILLRMIDTAMERRAPRPHASIDAEKLWNIPDPSVAYPKTSEVCHDT